MAQILNKPKVNCRDVVASSACKILLFCAISNLTACAADTNKYAASNYNVDELARDWRAQFRKNPHNIYEEHNLRIVID